MKNDAFISYRRDNGYTAAKLMSEKLFSDYGLKCFLDHEQIRAERFDTRLLEAVRDAPYFLLILSPGALDRCLEQNDWVRKEIETAVDLGKRIIPVQCDGFVWPEGIALPDVISSLKCLQRVTFSQEYIEATVERTVLYMNSLSLPQTLPLHTSEFLNSIYDECTESIASVDMALFYGDCWYNTPRKSSILSRYIDLGANVRIIINKKDVIESINKHMRQQNCVYVDPDDNIRNWVRFADAYNGHMQVRVLDVPLMHRTLLVRMKDGTGIVNVKYYTYANTIPEKDPRQIFISPTEQLSIYRDEFDYLWNLAEDCKNDYVG